MCRADNFKLVAANGVDRFPRKRQCRLSILQIKNWNMRIFSLSPAVFALINTLIVPAYASSEPPAESEAVQPILKPGRKVHASWALRESLRLESCHWWSTDWSGETFEPERNTFHYSRQQVRLGSTVYKTPSKTERIALVNLLALCAEWPGVTKQGRAFNDDIDLGAMRKADAAPQPIGGLAKQYNFHRQARLAWLGYSSLFAALAEGAALFTEGTPVGVHVLAVLGPYVAIAALGKALQPSFLSPLEDEIANFVRTTDQRAEADRVAVQQKLKTCRSGLDSTDQQKLKTSSTACEWIMEIEQLLTPPKGPDAPWLHVYRSSFETVRTEFGPAVAARMKSQSAEALQSACFAAKDAGDAGKARTSLEGCRDLMGTWQGSTVTKDTIASVFERANTIRLDADRRIPAALAAGDLETASALARVLLIDLQVHPSIVTGFGSDLQSPHAHKAAARARTCHYFSEQWQRFTETPEQLSLVAPVVAYYTSPGICENPKMDEISGTVERATAMLKRSATAKKAATLAGQKICKSWRGATYTIALEHDGSFLFRDDASFWMGRWSLVSNDTTVKLDIERADVTSQMMVGKSQFFEVRGKMLMMEHDFGVEVCR